MIRGPPRATLDHSSAASDVYKRQDQIERDEPGPLGWAGLGERLEHVPAGVVDQDVDRAPPCLLYTSPSPRDRTRLRMPSSA